MKSGGNLNHPSDGHPLRCARRCVVMTVLIALWGPDLLMAAKTVDKPKPPNNVVRHEPEVSAEEGLLLKRAKRLSRTDPAGAARLVKNAILPTSSAALDFARAVFLSRAEKLTEAEGAYQAAVKKMPTFVRAWEALGRVRLLRNRYREATVAFREVLRHGKPSAEVWKFMGYGYLAADQPIAAESAYRQALAFKPRDRETKLGLAKTLLAQNRQRAALPLLRDLCEAEPTRSEYWLLQANAHLELRETDTALEILESTYRLGLLDAESQMTLGDLYYNRCLPRLAGERYGRAYETGKINDERLLRCAEVLHHAEDADGALKLLKRLKSPAAELKSRARLLAGRIALERQDKESARKYLDESLEANPLNGEALFALAELQRNANETDRAILTLERASRLRGLETKALLLLAEIEVGRDRFAKAVTYLERAQELRPSPSVGRYLEQVRKLAEEEAGPDEGHQ